MLDELWTEVCDIVQETGIKTIPKKKKCKKPKWLSGDLKMETWNSSGKGGVSGLAVLTKYQPKKKKFELVDLNIFAEEIDK